MAAAITGKPVIAGAAVEQHCDDPLGPAGRADPQAQDLRRRRRPRWSGRPSPRRPSCRPSGGRGASTGRPANPVEVYLILERHRGARPRVDEVVEFADIEPDAIDHMIARGWEPQMPTDAAKLHPDLFP